MVGMLVENYPGVLSQVIRLFSRKGYNIQSVAVDTTDNPDITRITIITYGDEMAAQFILRQLHKQVAVIAAKLLDRSSCVQRGLVMVKLASDTKEKRDEIIQVVNIFRGQIVDINQECLTVSITGDLEKIEAFIKLAEHFGILEIVQSGIVALDRGKTTIFDNN
ncbi:MAG: acetolactate synthase small subunit [Chloroflexi bacterium]|nr:acetolactate synthase small subunit [Chloroflexota bacterium]